LVWWNQAGPQGTTAPAEPKGEPGLGEDEKATGSMEPAAKQRKHIEVRCPTGKVALTGS
jgi:hypothetical protein